MSFFRDIIVLRCGLLVPLYLKVRCMSIGDNIILLYRSRCGNKVRLWELEKKNQATVVDRIIFLSSQNVIFSRTCKGLFSFLRLLSRSWKNV
jgi:hypothetical protein